MTYTPKNKFSNNYSGLRNTPKRPLGALLAKIIGAGIVLFGLFFFLNNRLSGSAITLLSPVMKISGNISNNLSSAFSIFEPQTNLIAENNALKAEVERLQEENLAYQAQISENTILSVKTEDTPNMIDVLPLSFPPKVPFDTLIINKGQNDGLHAGDKVFLADRIEVGTVESVYSDSGRVTLFTSPGKKTESIFERTGEVVELEGYGSGTFKVQLPKSFDVQEGDLLVLPGLPRTIIAKVATIKRDDASSFITILLSAPIKINGNTLLYVQVE